MTHLFVILIGDVDAIDFDDAVAPAQLSRLCRRISVNFADKVADFLLVGHQVEAETHVALPLDDVTQPHDGPLESIDRIITFPGGFFFSFVGFFVL